MNIQPKLKAGLLFTILGLALVLWIAVLNQYETKKLSGYPSKNIVVKSSWVDSFKSTSSRGIEYEYYEMELISLKDNRFFIRSDNQDKANHFKRRIPLKTELLVYYSDEMARNHGYDIRAIYSNNRVIYDFDEYLKSMYERDQVVTIIGVVLAVIGLFFMGLYFEEQSNNE